MISTFIVHGVVQGVGYRAFVKGAAEALGIRGFARNSDNGSVEIVADGSVDAIGRFERKINVSSRRGVQVMKIERHNGNLLPECGRITEGFQIIE